MEKINVIKRKRNSNFDFQKTSCTEDFRLNISKNKKKQFKTNILVLNKTNNRKNLNKKTRIIGSINQQLLELGYSMECIKYCYEKYKFDSIEKALDIIMKDYDTGKYNHNFFSITNYQKIYGEVKTEIPKEDYDKICIICKDNEKNHFNYIENDLSLLSPNNKDNNSRFPFLNDYSNNCLSDLNKKSNNKTIKLDSFQNKANFKTCFPHIQININLINNIKKDLESKKELCLICYSTELSNENSLKMECGHQFCFDCYIHYIKDKIENGIVNIKCLMAGCINIIPDKIIKQFSTQDLYRKYIKFKKRNLYIENMKKGLIPCIHPDCEEWIKYKDGDDPNVTCKEGHSFCAKCKQKQHKGKRCKLYDRNINIDSRIKPCPNCNYLIEKNNKDNKIICPMCNFIFCWLCLGKCSQFHYYIINVRGCPLLRYSDPKNSKILNNNFIQCIWFFFSFIFTLIAFCFVAFLYILFGASYELIKFYSNKKNDIDHEFDSDVDLSDYANNANRNSNDNFARGGINNNNNIRNYYDNHNNNKTNKNDFFIYFLLFIVGIIVQPLFLVYKFLQSLMECYKKFGCWFFYMGNY